MQSDDAPLFTTLEVIADEPPQSAALNMAVDEALLGGLAEDPVLRIYRWHRAAVSFGYFDRVELVRSAYPDRELVRRWTGGGVVEHGRDFTYSLIVPRTHPLTALRAEESYRLLHGRLAVAIAAAAPDLPATEAYPAGGEKVDPNSRACFVNAVRHDLLLAGRKIAGAAQRRTRRGWLHQGSIQLPNEAEDIYERLRQTLPVSLGTTIRRRDVRSQESTAARRLATEKYGALDWLCRL